MDRDTIGIYDAKAHDYAVEWEEEQPVPDDLYDILLRFFQPGPTVDVGCGSGRDAAWLAAHGFPDVLGVDPSDGLLAEARARHPGVRFEQDSLPGLETLPAGTFANVLCETVLMHLPASSVAGAARGLAALLAPGGTLYLSWRVTDGADARDRAGRLYAAFDAGTVRAALAGTEILHDETETSTSSGRVIHRVVARRR